MVKNKLKFLKSAFAIDKVIEESATTLIILGCVSKIYADVVSLSSVVSICNAEIDTDFGRVVPFIKNQDKTWCSPLESNYYQEKFVNTILRLIEEFINQKNKQVIVC